MSVVSHRHTIVLAHPDGAPSKRSIASCAAPFSSHYLMTSPAAASLLSPRPCPPGTTALFLQRPTTPTHASAHAPIVPARPLPAHCSAALANAPPGRSLCHAHHAFRVSFVIVSAAAVVAAPTSPIVTPFFATTTAPDAFTTPVTTPRPRQGEAMFGYVPKAGFFKRTRPNFFLAKIPPPRLKADHSYARRSHLHQGTDCRRLHIIVVAVDTCSTIFSAEWVSVSRRMTRRR